MCVGAFVLGGRSSVGEIPLILLLLQLVIPESLPAPLTPGPALPHSPPPPAAAGPADDQLSFADVAAEELKAALLATDLNTLTPLEAMNLLFELQRKARG